MDTDKIAKMISEHRSWSLYNKRFAIDETLIDALADEFKIQENRYTLSYHESNLAGHKSSYDDCRACNPFDHAEFVRIALGEPNPESS